MLKPDLYFQFSPELVIVSAGYDAAVGCPEVRNLNVPCYHALSLPAPVHECP